LYDVCVAIAVSGQVELKEIILAEVDPAISGVASPFQGRSN